MGPLKRRSTRGSIEDGLPQTVFALGLVSLFTDLSSEMIYPLLPLFLTQVLGAGALSLGVLEGIAETTAAVLKIISGTWSDRLPRRKPLVFAGYSLSGFARPLIGLASSFPFVLVMRFADRVGKGIRTTPRDALIADVTSASLRGRAYGVQRAMDHAGAVAGPLVAAALLAINGMTLRHVFLLAAIPSVVVILIILTMVREQAQPRVARPMSFRADWKDLGGNFKYLLLVLIVFTLGNSADAFLLLRMSHQGMSAQFIAVLWSLHHVVKVFATYAGGRLSDRTGRRAMIVAGWVLYAAVYLAFGLVQSRTGLVVIFLVYGIYYGLTEPTEKAWVADLVPGKLRGTAFGFYNGAIGIAALPASLVFGLVWQRWSATAAFSIGAALALIAVLALVAGPFGGSRRPTRPSGSTA